VDVPRPAVCYIAEYFAGKGVSDPDNETKINLIEDRDATGEFGRCL